MNCYCCSGKTFTECCEPYLSLKKDADSCEALMRSRYSAYCIADTAYLGRIGTIRISRFPGCLQTR